MTAHKKHALGYFIEPFAGRWWILGPSRKFGPLDSEVAAREKLAEVLRGHRQLRRHVVF